MSSEEADVALLLCPSLTGGELFLDVSVIFLESCLSFKLCASVDSVPILGDTF